MTADRPTIIASSIGFRGVGASEWDWSTGPIHDLAVEYAHAGPAPRVCIIATALGDNPTFLTAVYSAFGRAGYRTTHLALTPQPNVKDVRGFLLDQDVIWVAGGSVANLLAIWEAHGLGPILREAWQAGVVLSGVSAGSVCWFDGGTTDSFGLPLRAVTNGLGFLPFANSAHHDAEPTRRPRMIELLVDSTFSECYATENGTALVFRGTTLHEAVTESEGAVAWHLRRELDGSVTETPLPTRLIGNSASG